MSETITGHVGSRGTITLAAETRRRYGLEDGSLFIQEERPDGILIRPAKAIPSDLSEVRAKIQKGIEDFQEGRVMTLEESTQRLAKIKSETRRRARK